MDDIWFVDTHTHCISGDNNAMDRFRANKFLGNPALHFFRQFRMSYNVLKVLLCLFITSDIPCDNTLLSYRVTRMTSPRLTYFLTTVQQQRHTLPDRRQPLGAPIRLPEAPRSVKSMILPAVFE